jgi:predicted Zn finger-like uncharacterized protein
MPENLIRIACPECHTGFRIDPDAVPEQGATAACRKCGRKFMIRKTPGGSVATEAWIPPAETVRTDAPQFTCPSCGHRQSQPFTCYACGAVITPKEPSSNAVPPPASPAAVPEAPGLQSLMNQIMGEIIVRTRFKPSNWLLRLARPCVSIDGMENYKEWGAHAFQAPYGDCAVVVDCKFFGASCARSAIQINVVQNDKTFVDYFAESLTAPGRLRKAAFAEGMLWQIHTEVVRIPGKWYTSRKAVIVSLFVLGPLGLIQLWKSDQFSIIAKMVITAAVILITIWLISKLSMPAGLNYPGLGK